MYCPSCGKSVNKGLKFCNGCGMRLEKDRESDGNPDRMLFMILGPLTFIVIAGFGALIGLVAVLLFNQVSQDILAIAIGMWLATLAVISYALIGKASKVIDHRLKSNNAQTEDSIPRQLPSVQTGQLEEYREPVMSVTDHTTKTLDSVPVKRN